jgi:hypothetical protein
MGKEMRSVLRGVIKDHRLVGDYELWLNQPVHSRAFIRGIKRFLATRHMTKTNVTFPLYAIFAIGVPFFLIGTTYHYLYSGYWPTAMQRHNWLFRKGHYGQQIMYNTNPDNYYNSNFDCWTTDPLCGVDVGPKRPWEDLKEPEKVLFKFKREANEDVRRKVNGFRGC